MGLRHVLDFAVSRVRFVFIYTRLITLIGNFRGVSLSSYLLTLNHDIPVLLFNVNELESSCLDEEMCLILTTKI